MGLPNDVHPFRVVVCAHGARCAGVASPGTHEGASGAPRWRAWHRRREFDIDDGFLQVTLSPAPQLNLPPVPVISLATILQPTDTTDTSSPFGGSDLPTINLPPIPPL